MTGLEWIGVLGVASASVTTLVVNHKRTTDALKETIRLMLVERIGGIEKSLDGTDKWVGEIEKEVKDTSGEVKVLKSRIDDVKADLSDVRSRCERRHTPRGHLEPGVG